MMNNSPRIAILYSGLSDYSAACQRALKVLYNVRILVVHWPVSSEAPYDSDIYDHIDQRFEKKEMGSETLYSHVADFDPDALLISGWMDKDYLDVARKFRHLGIPVIAGCDTQFTGKLKQCLGKIIAPWYLHNAIDVLWVPGERQKQLANYLGYSGNRCWTGFYSCNWHRFADADIQVREQAFLFTGRYIERKGLLLLLEAYRQYRHFTSEPWELWVAGTGKLQNQIQSEEGVQDFGFVQPSALPELMRRAGAFVLPSFVEPWGVALQEAAVSCLPLICSEACGSGVHLVQPHYNGYTFATGDTSDLSRCLSRIAELPVEELQIMGGRSLELSKQYTPERWAEILMEGLADLKMR